jgi:hypothetical protein
MVAIPLPTGTTQGSARAVNSSGWAVGTASSAFAIPFLYNGSQTFRLADLIPAGTGWDLATNTSTSAMGISDNGFIVGTGVINGATHAYLMVPVPAGGAVTLSGRVTTSDGRGIRSVLITLSGGGLAAPISARTGLFGYYSFTGLTSGQIYTMTIGAKNYTFTPSNLNVVLPSNLNIYNITANP